MSSTTKTLINAAATAIFAIAAAATTVTNAFAQTTPAAAAGTSAAKAVVAGSAVAAAQTEQPGLTREQVKAEYLEARKNGELLETEADFDVARIKKHVVK